MENVRGVSAPKTHSAAGLNQGGNVTPALYFVFYNFVKRHTTLRVSPAMQAGLSDHLWSMEDILGLIDAKKVTAKRGPYTKKEAIL